MNVCVYNQTKENVAKGLGIAKFSDATKVSGQKRDDMVAKAQKNLKVKCHTRTRNLSSGNPYIMLGRKIDSRGKMVR